MIRFYSLAAILSALAISLAACSIDPEGSPAGATTSSAQPSHRYKFKLDGFSTVKARCEW